MLICKSYNFVFTPTGLHTGVYRASEKAGAATEDWAGDAGEGAAGTAQEQGKRWTK